MTNIKALTGRLTKNLATFLDVDNNLYPSKNALPGWMPQIFKPIPYTNKIIIDKDLQFNITENICGLTVNFGFIKDGVFHNCVAYNKNGKQIPEIISKYPKIKTILADMQKQYNTNCIVLQVKFLENNNYYKIMPKIIAFKLYFDGIEQTLTNMAEILREYNIEIVPVLDLNKKIDKDIKKNYSEISLLSNVPSRGIICTNRQKELSFLF